MAFCWQKMKNSNNFSFVYLWFFISFVSLHKCLYVINRHLLGAMCVPKSYVFALIK